MGGMTGLDPTIDTASNYRRFALREAAGRSPAYEQLGLAVAEDGVVLGFLEKLPRGKRQPNLLFAASRHLLGEVPTPGSVRYLVEHRADELAGVMRARRTQTNEPARCATLLPALCLLPQPLALLEVGASAGLTLLPDYYSYDYGSGRITGKDAEGPVLKCTLTGPVPVPREVPEVAWRAGIDVNPLDVNRHEDLEWLACLVWPGEEGREDRLRAAAETARRHPPAVHRGDLVDDLGTVASEAPADATLVVFHSAVLAYVDHSRRRKFVDAVRQLDAVWLSNEGSGVLPDGPPSPAGQHFLLIRDGKTVLAETDGHGAWVRWRG
jgi:hypothetical protein